MVEIKDAKYIKCFLTSWRPAEQPLSFPHPLRHQRHHAVLLVQVNRILRPFQRAWHFDTALALADTADEIGSAILFLIHLFSSSCDNGHRHLGTETHNTTL